MMEEGIYPMNRENLQALSTESGRLIYLLDELRTLADIESPEPVLLREILNLPDLLQEAVTAAGPVFFRKDVDVEIRSGSPYPVNADRGKLLQVLINLLSNALRYADSRILIRIGKQAGSSGWTELIVEDDGPGIPAQERGKIFQRFYRVDTSRNRSSGGSGLGLAICREIVKAHGGRIAAGASGELGGAELRMVLPGSAAPDRTPERFRG
jgi:two-component system sensor histidine kinase BaeS